MNIGRCIFFAPEWSNNISHTHVDTQTHAPTHSLDVDPDDIFFWAMQRLCHAVESLNPDASFLRDPLWSIQYFSFQTDKEWWTVKISQSFFGLYNGFDKMEAWCIVAQLPLASSRCRISYLIFWKKSAARRELIQYRVSPLPETPAPRQDFPTSLWF